MENFFWAAVLRDAARLISPMPEGRGFTAQLITLSQAVKGCRTWRLARSMIGRQSRTTRDEAQRLAGYDAISDTEYAHYVAVLRDMLTDKQRRIDKMSTNTANTKQSMAKIKAILADSAYLTYEVGEAECDNSHLNAFGQTVHQYRFRAHRAIKRTTEQLAWEYARDLVDARLNLEPIPNAYTGGGGAHIYEISEEQFSSIVAELDSLDREYAIALIDSEIAQLRADIAAQAGKPTMPERERAAKEKEYAAQILEDGEGYNPYANATTSEMLQYYESRLVELEDKKKDLMSLQAGSGNA
jgi:hypothetical protein